MKLYLRLSSESYKERIGLIYAYTPERCYSFRERLTYHARSSNNIFKREMRPLKVRRVL